MVTSTKALANLLEQAKAADPSDRMQLRDPVAEHGVAAIDGLTPWLADPKLRGFAIRTIGKAGSSGHRSEAVDALRSVPAKSPPHVLNDVDEALAALGARRQALAQLSSGSATPLGDEINDDLYSYLVEAAEAGRYVTYTEAGEIVGLTMRNPHHRRLIGQLLGQISTREAELGRPMLSSIVVNKDQKSKLGQGFYQLGEELRHKQVGEDPDSFAKSEAAKTFEYWRSSSTTLTPRASVTGAPDYKSRGSHEDPPPALGGCEFTGATGQCQNPGRWDRDGHLSCTTHALARAPLPWRP